MLVVVGGGAAGIFGAIRAKSVCPYMDVFVLEKSQLLSKVKISGGGRCNVTTGLFEDPLILSEQYPRGHKELRGSFFRVHGPKDTAMWFHERGIALKTEEDGRMFPVTDTSATIVDCLLDEAHKQGVWLQTGAPVKSVSLGLDSMFKVHIGGVKKSTSLIEADFLLLATGSSQQGYDLAKQLGHTLIDPRPSLFTFKVADQNLQELAGVSFQDVQVELEIVGQKHRDPNLTQIGPMLITHWGLSGPVVLRLSAWAARELFSSNYQGMLWVDFLPNIKLEDVIRILDKHRKSALKRKLGSGAPNEFPLVRRFWQYLLSRSGIALLDVWATISNNALRQVAFLVKRCPFSICGKGEFKEEFVTSGGVPLVEVDLKTMESRLCPQLYFAGEILNIDGVTGGFNFQNAWTGGYIAGTSVALKLRSVL